MSSQQMQRLSTQSFITSKSSTKHHFQYRRLQTCKPNRRTDFINSKFYSAEFLSKCNLKIKNILNKNNLGKIISVKGIKVRW